MNLLSIADINIPKALLLAEQVKKNPEAYKHSLDGLTLAAIFEKPSTRTWLSFAVGAKQLGCNFLELPDAHMLSGHEDGFDTANTIAQYADFLLARVYSHEQLAALAAHSPIPVINGLSDIEHPCQALADLLTIKEHKGLANVKVAYIGDANNVCNSLLLGCAALGIEIAVASPKGYGPKAWVLEKAKGAKVSVSAKPALAVKGADAVYTDVWASMGEEKMKGEKLKAFSGFCVTPHLMSLAKPNAIFMHCLPAQKGVEVSKEVIEGPQSVVFAQAANRLHVQKAMLLMLADAAKQKSAILSGVKT